MGVLDRLLAQPVTPRGLAAGHATLDQGRSITFAAQRIEPGVKPDKRGTARQSLRSAEQWNAYEHVGEIGYVVDLFGNALRRIRIFPAGVDDPEEGRVPLEECSWASRQLVADATAALDRIRSVEHGQGEVLAQMAINLKVAGAGHLYATIDDTTGLEDWQVISTDALVYQRGAWSIKATPDDRKPTPIDLATDPIWRFWQRHPRWHGLAYSEMSRILGHAEDLQILERAARARGRSRIAGAGILVMSNRYTLNSRRSPNGPTGGDFFDDFLAAGTAALTDEGSPSSVMPIMADFDVDDARKVMHHVTLDRPLTDVEERREDKLLRRIAQGLDAPPELVTGMADLNHWTAWQVEDSTYEAHIEPLALRIADILAITALRSALLAAGHAPDVVARVTTGVDPADLIRRPNRVADSKDAHDKLVISDAALRKDLGYTDDDAPEMDELLRRMALKRGITTEMLTAELLANYADADVARTIAKGDASTAQAEAAAEATDPDTAVGNDDQTDEGVPATAPDGVTAAAGPNVGARLQAIDLDLTARLTGATEVAVEHALQRATSRAANRSRGHGSELAATIREGGRGLLARLSARGSAQVGLRDDELITDTDFDTLRDQWGTWVADAYQAGQDEITTASGQPVDLDVDDDIDAGWLLLAAGLIGAARSALRVAAGEAVGTSGDGTVGETDPAAPVQPGLLRRSLARAGGAHGQETDGGAVLVDGGLRPAGGVATGEQILQAAVDAGLVLTGWTWMTGAPARPFPPHQALAGTSFAQFDAPALANAAGEWPGVAHWHPGDHLGCRCTAQPNLEAPSSN